MYLGIDLGTSGVKSVLIDDSQKFIGQHSSRPLDVSRPHRGWSEQDPAIWWDGVCQTLDGLAASHPKELAAVKAIGLSGQMYGATVLDAHDKPLRTVLSSANLSVTISVGAELRRFPFASHTK